MSITNTTFIFLTLSNLLASPLYIQSPSSNIQLISFQRSSFYRFSSSFFLSSALFSKNYRQYEFNSLSFSYFLDTPIKIEGINIANTTHTEQKAVSVYSDVFISYCMFKNCYSKSGSGGGLSVTTPSSLADLSPNSIKFQLLSSTFYNCSALSGGGIFIQFNGDISISNVCFNNCEAKVSNQAGFVDVASVQPNSQVSINFTSIFRCPHSSSSSLSSYRGMKNCFHIKADDLSINVNNINSTYNENNNDRGSILTLTGLKDAFILYSIVMNNDGSDGFSLLRVRSLSIQEGLIVNNTFSIAPFNSYGSITVIPTYIIYLYDIQYINNNVSDSKDITGSITIYMSNCIIEPLDSSFGRGSLSIIPIGYMFNNRISKNNFLYESNIFPESCFFIQSSTTLPAKKSQQISLDLIIYSLIGACCLIIICISIVLIVYCAKKKRKLRKWIEENETSKQNSSLSTSAFVDPLLEQNN